MFAEFPKNRFVGQISDVFGIIEGSRCTGAFIGFFPMARFTGKDPCYEREKFGLNEDGFI